MKKSDSLSLAGMIVGIIACLLAFVPCIGVFGALIGIVSLILSFIGLGKDKRNGASTTQAVVGIVFSILSLIIVAAWFFFIGSTAKNGMNVDITDCSQAIPMLEATVTELESIKAKGDDIALSDVTTMLSSATKIAGIQAKVKELDCTTDAEFKAEYDALLVRNSNTLDQ